ncbi:putative GPN-loop GTPase 1 [Blattamonas nauphoetae]|uniref:GPN-loop GTPase n=1 Tax=Blattamonas nauphoetae TaxID=2049346 RepID=A0ABQ9YEN5_9EUKA|nr:putative GPN-loop GTPase 1 [Blattamonas nauphoetae]
MTDPVQPEPSSSSLPRKPLVLIFIGMAGSGKSTLVDAIRLSLKANGKRVYTINLDPAVTYLSYRPNIDIRDTVNYKTVMSQYTLGPNGAILTSLNFFATKFDQVLQILEKKTNMDYILIDTPGQIEMFTWSASGQILTDALASSFPTVINYIIDTPRSQNPATFMSNMLYACSVMYKSKLPLQLLFNKVDIIPSQFIHDWMNDSDKLQSVLDQDDSYMSTLTHSMSLVLEEFYSTLKHASVSALSREGFEQLETLFEEGRKEYDEVFFPLMEEMKQERQKKQDSQQSKEFEKVLADYQAEKEQREIEPEKEAAERPIRFVGVPVQLGKEEEDEDVF